MARAKSAARSGARGKSTGKAASAHAKARRTSTGVAAALERIELRRASVDQQVLEARACLEEFLGAGGAALSGFGEDDELYRRLVHGRPHLEALLGPHAPRGRTSGARFAPSTASERVAVLSRVVAFLSKLEDGLAADADAIDAELTEVDRSGAWRPFLYRDFEEFMERVLGPDPTLGLLMSVNARRSAVRPVFGALAFPPSSEPQSLRAPALPPSSEPRSLRAPTLPPPSAQPSMQAPAFLARDAAKEEDEPPPAFLTGDTAQANELRAPAFLLSEPPPSEDRILVRESFFEPSAASEPPPEAHDDGAGQATAEPFRDSEPEGPDSFGAHADAFFASEPSDEAYGFLPGDEGFEFPHDQAEFGTDEPDANAAQDADDAPAWLSGREADDPVGGPSSEAATSNVATTAIVQAADARIVPYRKPFLTPIRAQLALTLAAVALGAALGWQSVMDQKAHPKGARPTPEAHP